MSFAEQASMSRVIPTVNQDAGNDNNKANGNGGDTDEVGPGIEEEGKINLDENILDDSDIEVRVKEPDIGKM